MKATLVIPFNNTTNKDLLIVSLLEYICTQQHPTKLSLFPSIINHLKSNDVINDIGIDSDEYDKIKGEFIHVFNELIQINSEPTLELNTGEIMPICNSRYDNDFVELERISNGGFGVVYKTIHKLDKVRYAIKKIPLISGHNFEKVNSTKILNEAILLANLNHDNIIRYYSTWVEINNDDLVQKDVDESSSSSSDNDSQNKIVLYNHNNGKISLRSQINKTMVIYIQMELCTMTLKDYILQTKLSKIDTKNIIKDIVKAINYIHSRKIIHCDLSLKNILINVNNTIKLCDFGLAEYMENNDHVIKSKTYGALTYCAPESIKYNKYSYKSDIYSLGIIIYELLNKFGTEMERMLMIKKFKTKELKFEYDNILYKMIDGNDVVRPFITDILFI